MRRQRQKQHGLGQNLESTVRWINICRWEHAGRPCSAVTQMFRCALMAQTDFGTRCEIKNLNSFRFLEKAIDR